MWLNDDQVDHLLNIGSASDGAAQNQVETQLATATPSGDGTVNVPQLSPLTVLDTPGDGPAATPPASSPSRTHRPGPIGAGVRFAHYRILGELGQGGMAVVYRAVDERLNREVALKTLRTHELQEPEYVQRLRREAQTAAGLRHESIVPIYEVGEFEGVPYFAMAYVPGRTFADALDQGEVPALRDRVRLIHEAALAVAHAHETGVIHRDLKPSNLMLDRSGRIHVMDFGLAVRLGDANRITTTGQIIGTPQYMAPEQLDADADRCGPATDVFALGGILYEALTGRNAFEGKTYHELLRQVLMVDPARPSRWNPAVPPDLEVIALKALRKEVSERYPSAKEFAGDLAQYLKGEAISARRETWWERTGRWVRRRKPLALLAAAGLVAALAALGLGWRAEVESRERRRLEQEHLLALRDTAALTVQGTLLVRRSGGRMDQAEAAFLAPLERAARAVERLAPETPEPHFHRGRMYRALMRFGDALREQDRALAKDPAYAPSLYERSILQARAYRALLQEQELAATPDRWASPPRGGGGALAASLGEAEAGAVRARSLHDDLVDTLARLLRRTRDPGAQDPNLSRGSAECAEGLGLLYAGEAEPEWERGQRLLEAALAADPFLEEAYEGLAYRETCRNGQAQAIEVLGRGIDVDRGNVSFLISRGQLNGFLAIRAARSDANAEERFEQSLADLTRALELAPSDVKGWRLRAEVWLERALDLMRRSGDCEGSFERAVADFTRALELDPGNAGFQCVRGTARSQWGFARQQRGIDPEPLYREAEADFDAAARRAPDLLEVPRQRGSLYRNWSLRASAVGGDPEPYLVRATAEYARVLDACPDEPEAWSHHAAALANWGDGRGARGEDPRPQYREADQDLERALTLAPDDAEILVTRAGVRQGWGTWSYQHGADGSDLYRLARQDLDRAVEIDPARADARLARARLAMNAGTQRLMRGEDPESEFATAEADFARAIEGSPHPVVALQTRALLRMNWAGARAGRGADAAPLLLGADEDLGRAMALAPHDASLSQRRGDLRWNRAIWASQIGEDPEPWLRDAAADLSRSLELNPADAGTWISRAGVRAAWANHVDGKGGDPRALFDEAARDFAKGLELDPSQAEPWASAARLEVARGKFLARHGQDPSEPDRRADEAYRKAHALDPGLAGIAAERAQLCAGCAARAHAAGSDAEPWYREADREFGEALQQEPNRAVLRLARGLMLAAWGQHRKGRDLDPAVQYERAESEFTQTIEATPDSADAWLGRGHLRSQRGVHEEDAGRDPSAWFAGAWEDLERTARLAPQAPQVFEWRAIVRLLQDRDEEAIGEFEALAARAPERAEDCRAAIENARLRIARQATIQPRPGWVGVCDHAERLHGIALDRRALAAYERAFADPAIAGERERGEALADEARRLRWCVARYEAACLLTRQPAAEAHARALVHLRAAVAAGWIPGLDLASDERLTALRGQPGWSELVADAAARPGK